VEIGEVDQLIKKLRWDNRVTSGGTQLQITICPFCGDNNGHFYINREDGRFFCQKAKCNAKGGWYQFQKFTKQLLPIDPVAVSRPIPLDVAKFNLNVEAWHKDLWGHKNALDYLTHTRKFSFKAIKHFKLGIMEEYGKEWLVIPDIQKGAVKTIKYRRLDQKQYRHTSGTSIDLFHTDALNEGHSELIITEGEPDCIAIWSHGYRNVVAVPGASQWKPEWMQMLVPFKKIFLCYDQDDGGKLGAKEMAKRLGYHRCFNVQLPMGIKDANDFFINSTKGKSKFQRLLDKARQVDVPYVIPVGDSVRDVILKKRVVGSADVLTTPWVPLNRIIKGVAPESLIFLTAHPGVGKSTAALQWLYYLAKEGRPVGYVCIEMSSDEMTSRLLNVHTRSPEQTPEERIQAMQDLTPYPFYWIDLAKHGNVKFPVLADTIRDASLRYDLKIIVVDHFHFMIRSLKYVTEETGKLAQQFKLLARETGIPMMCIAHVTKQSGIPKRVVGNDLRDSGLLYADADYIFILHRNPKLTIDKVWNGEWEEEVEIGVFKSRHSITGVVRGLTFFGDIGVIE